MSDSKKENTSIFNKAMSATNAWLDMQIHKAKNMVSTKDSKSEEEFYAKTIETDPSGNINSQGYKEKQTRLQDSHLKQMSLKDSVISSIIVTRQNHVASFSDLAKSNYDKGFRIVLKDEQALLDEIIEELKNKSNNEDIEKSEQYDDSDEDENNEQYDDASDDKQEITNWDLLREAKKKLKEQIREKQKEIEEFILNCGKVENRPFESKKWSFDSMLRAIVRDSLTYDRLAIEVVPDEKNQPHHLLPVDASTVKFATPELKKYKSFAASQTPVDLLYPEKQVEALVEDRDAVELDDELLEADKYKYVQVIRGKIERAYTEDELKVGMRNLSTDIYANGYSISELELLVSLVSSHLNTEAYNQLYFTQGFSAKGILHLKSPINKRKLDTVRQQWQHMLKGSKNSFQTPIFAGTDEVKWIPLTQNHNDIGFQNWLNYLIKMICAIYQIDPVEIGIGMKEEGGSGGGLNGDNTSEKIQLSKDKGLKPFLRFISNFINKNVIDSIDNRFKLEFVGLDDESKHGTLERQEKEVKFKKTINEIRAEDNLPPIPGGDDLILDSNYMQYFMQFSDKAKENQQQMGYPNMGNEGEAVEEDEMDQEESDDETNEHFLSDLNLDKSLKKSNSNKLVKIEYYKVK